MRKWIAWILVCIALLGGAAGAETVEPTPSPVVTPVPTPAPGGLADGRIRVRLESLGAPLALGMTLDGVYAVDGDRGFRFDKGTEIAIGIDGENIALKAGGATIDMGSGFTLTRHLDETGAAGGVYIHESERDTLYCGDVRVEVYGGALRVIVTLPVEDYLYGVVPYEMSDAWPLEALKAQAVAARTYALQRKARNAGQPYDLVDTPNDQVYRGLDARYTNAIRAVDETRGVVGLVGGSFAEMFYTASNGGQTASATDVWGGAHWHTAMLDDPYDLENPESIVKEALIPSDGRAVPEPLYGLLVNELGVALQAQGVLEVGEAVGLGEITAVEAVNPVYGGDSRQYGVIRFTILPTVRRFQQPADSAFRMLGLPETLETPMTVDLSFYDQVRSALGIAINDSRYDLVQVTPEEEAGFRLTVRRYGHGVGMSQRGAQQMAEAHQKNYLEILAFYYPGLTLSQMQWQSDMILSIEALPASLGYAAPRPTPAPTPAPLPPLGEGEYYAAVRVEGVTGTLNVRLMPTTDSEKIGELRNGQRMIIQSETGDGWAQMKTAEIEGFVSMAFIVKE
ncbi:MAG: SpoIID/LytB domain-containing protein [Oscillospiraceae bacterium]|jgi:hypothetical protein|nr:SpoIID/LytB domain-containing protein [Oscillospiraceae bacterium]